jgi:hypothetical protein
MKTRAKSPQHPGSTVRPAEAISKSAWRTADCSPARKSSRRGCHTADCSANSTRPNSHAADCSVGKIQKSYVQRLRADCTQRNERSVA